jgi:hypothetical protein
MGMAEDNARDYATKRLIDEARRALQALEDDPFGGLNFDEDLYPLIGRLQKASDAIVRRWD